MNQTKRQTESARNALPCALQNSAMQSALQIATEHAGPKSGPRQHRRAGVSRKIVRRMGCDILPLTKFDDDIMRQLRLAMIKAANRP